MVFSSLDFLFFFSAFFFLYWFVFNKSLRLQNFFLLVASYVFYTWWDWRFLTLLIGSSALNFLLGIYIQKADKYRKLLLYIGLLEGIGALLFFKYFNFFITSMNDALHSLNIHANLQTLNIILPLGISFYTFRMMSYLLDVDKRKLEPTKDWVVFFAYVSFFPSVMSGPIDKAKMFIPQLEKKRVFDKNQSVDGLRQILWGLFKKLVVADNCGLITGQIFENYEHLKASALLFGAFLYTIQIYADFSGYSEMALGISNLLGFNITRNFNFPFFSKNIAEFWRRWHISLTSWLTEYLFTPLTITFRDYANTGLILAIIINFTIVGIWHGANWTYVLFGFLHGCYFIPLILKGTMNKKDKLSKGILPSFGDAIRMLGTFTLVMLTFILIRSETIGTAYNYISKLFSVSLFSKPAYIIGTGKTMFALGVMLFVEWLQRSRQHGLELFSIQSAILKLSIYYILIALILEFGAESQSFIYFKF